MIILCEARLKSFILSHCFCLTLNGCFWFTAFTEVFTAIVLLGIFLYRKKKLIIILCLAEKHWRSWSTISHDTSISDQVRILMQISTSLLYQRQSIPVNLFMMPCGQANSMFPFVSWIKVYFSSWNAQNILTVSNLSYKCTVFYALFWSSCFMMIWSYSAILSECFMINWYNNYVLSC